jgi:hypothetical protein
MYVKKQFKSPLVSCVCCKKEYSARGIFGHFFGKHDPNGIQVMSEIRKKGTDMTFRNESYQERFNKSIAKEKSTHKCDNPECKELTTNEKYCSRSCAAKITNFNRTRESYDRQSKTLSETISKIWRAPKQKQIKPRKVNTRKCICCGKIDTTTARFQSDKCSFCNDSLMYRRQCEFKFNLKDFPEEFDFKLLNEHGMFSPKKNPKGVSRDHMLSVQYGKDNRIDPGIIAHPANCRLILQGDNTRKQGDSSITLSELLIKINEWDTKYSNA